MSNIPKQYELPIAIAVVWGLCILLKTFGFAAASWLLILVWPLIPVLAVVMVLIILGPSA